MSQASLTVRSKFQQQIQRFLVTGVSAVLVDTLFYFLLIQVKMYPTSLSKMISFLCGTILAYILNKFWTFKKKAKSPYRTFSVYGLYIIDFRHKCCFKYVSFLLLLSNKIILLLFLLQVSVLFIKFYWTEMVGV